MKRFEGMLRVVRFNWPLYMVAAASALSLLILTAQPMFAGWMQTIFGITAALVLLQTTLSLLASHWVYDLSPLKDWRFLQELIQPAESNTVANKHTLCIVNVHSGYDETSGALRQLFSGADIATIDLFPTLTKREASIIRARSLYPPLTPIICDTVTNWPLAEHSVDLILIAFAAHEVREATQRDMLFAQAAKVLSPTGRIILVEHVRDIANFVAFGQGFMHFMPLAEWIRCATQNELKIAKQYKITPLVAVLELCL